MNSHVVVDASVAAKWLLMEEGSTEARRLAAAWVSEGIRVVAPRLLRYEIANALHQQVRRGNLSIDHALTLFADLLAIDIEFVDSMAMHRDAISVADRLGLRASYDALYLALAQRLDCECWTDDRELARAA